MSDIQIIKTPKYLVYDGNLYELISTNVIHALDYNEAINIAKQKQKYEQKIFNSVSASECDEVLNKLKEKKINEKNKKIIIKIKKKMDKR